MSNARLVGKVYQCFDELPSSNDYLLQWLGNGAKSKPPEGTVVRAASQSAGRGQFGSRWDAEPGQNLTVSLLLCPHWLPLERQFFLSMAVALAVRDTLAVFCDKTICVKWPNDIFIENKKTAGILIQNNLTGQKIQESVVGIGLNVNQLRFSPELWQATSMALASGTLFDLDTVMQHLFGELDARYAQLREGHLQDIKTAYEGHLYLRDARNNFCLTKDNTAFGGIIRGVTDGGLLRLECTDGTVQIFDLKEIALVTHETFTIAPYEHF